MADKLDKKGSAIETIRDLLNQNKDAIIAALPHYASPDRIFRIAMTCLRRNPELLKCDPMSFIGALIEANQLGLSLDPNLGEAYLVPFGGKAQLIPGYKGYIHLAKRSGDVAMVEAQVVCQNDQFSYKYGTGAFLDHTPAGNGRGETIAAYCLLTFASGLKQFHVMNKEELDKIRERSKAKNAGPWITDPEEMYRKTPVRNQLKYADLNPEVKRAIGLDQAYEAGLDQGNELQLAPIDAAFGAVSGTQKTVDALKTKATEATAKTKAAPAERDYRLYNEMLKEYKISPDNCKEWLCSIYMANQLDDIDDDRWAALMVQLEEEPAEVVARIAKWKGPQQEPKEPLNLEG